MDVKLMELKTGELLQKFGAGNHKPGSGSAAADLGLISAQMLRTVIDLTDKPKRQSKYSEWLPELRRIASEIDSRILPGLEKLFQTDSEQFDKTIKLRQERDQENNIQRKSFLAQQATKELEPATLIPIEIAKLCIELADFAAYVFSHGFKSARGDAGVAQNGAIAAIGGCLSIIHLNLLSFGNNSWTNQIIQEATQIRGKYQHLQLDAINSIDTLREEANRHNECQSDINALIENLPDEIGLTDAVIENIARELQLLLWKYKEVIWQDDDVNDPLAVLKPAETLRTMGYQFYRSRSLGEHDSDGELFNVAGLIDKKQKFVQVSNDFDTETQNFTAAHELGHALFHKQTILHRDRPLDGSAANHMRSRIEMQADKFAACFLMPRKQVTLIFNKLFSMDRFVANADNVFALTHGSVAAFRKDFETKRDVSRLLGKPLAAILFKVSLETMAIRLEELNLIDY